MAHDDTERRGNERPPRAEPVGGSSADDADPTRRGPGRPKRTAGATVPRPDVSILAQTVDRFISETSLVVRLNFDICSAAYRRFLDAKDDVIKHPGDHSFEMVLATVEGESRRRFEADVRRWAESLVRHFPDDDAAISWGRRLPDNVLQAVFITYAWNRENGRGGASRAEQVFQRDLKRLKSKLSTWRGKLIESGYPAAARFIALPIAGSIAILAEGKEAKATVGVKKITGLALVTISVLFGSFWWTRCNRGAANANSDNAAPTASSQRQTAAATPPSNPDTRANHKSAAASTSIADPTSIPGVGVRVAAVSEAWQQLTSAGERERRATFFAQGGPIDPRIGLERLELDSMDAAKGTVKLRISFGGSGEIPTCEAIETDDLFGGWCHGEDRDIGTLLLGWLVREEGTPRLKGVLWRVGLPGEPAFQQTFCFENSSLVKGQSCGVSPCFEADSPTSRQELARLCASHPTFTPCFDPKTWDLPTMGQRGSPCARSSTLQRIRE